MVDDRNAGDPGPRRPLPSEHIVGGLSCSEVLAALDAYFDRTLSPETRSAVEAHIRGCDQCDRFGAAYARVAKRIRHVTADTPAGQEILDRLRARLARKIG